MKKILLAAAVLLLSFSLQAQKPGFEVGVGLPFAMNKDGADKVKSTISVHMDGNFRIPLTRLTAGFRLGYSQFRREEMSHDFTCRTMQVLATGSYTFTDSKLLRPYIGIGAGVAFSNNHNGLFNDGYKSDFCIASSIGVLIVKHISLSVDYSIIRKQYSHAAVRLGLAF